jgi:acyl-CoA dehydrogenase
MPDKTPHFSLPHEHRAVGFAVRDVCDDKVAPHAAEVDEHGCFPGGVRRTACIGLSRPHIPEQYGGAGADALTTCLVIEEVAVPALPRH